MARKQEIHIPARKSLENSSKKDFSILEKLLLIIAFVFIRIGDGIKLPFFLLYRQSTKSINKVKRIKIPRSKQKKGKQKKKKIAFLSTKIFEPKIILLKEKFIRINSHIEEKNEQWVKKIQKIRISKIIIPTIKFKLPQFPKIALPKIVLPKIKFPQIEYKIKVHKPKLIVIEKPKLWKLKIIWFTFGALCITLFIFLPYIMFSWINSLPHPGQLVTRDIPATTKIYDRNGNLLYQIYANQNRTPVKLSEIPDSLKKATIAIEDREFYHHNGFDIKGIIRAARETYINKRIQGGSTITQQLIKSALLTPEQSIKRKVKELLLAFWTEKIYSKDQILEMYFNQVPYGGTAWGIEAASETYFNKHVSELNLSEATLLAGLPAAPTTYSPFGSHPELAKRRQNEVLKRMVEDGYITKIDREETLKQPLSYADQKIEIKAPHFVLYIKDLLVKQYGLQEVEQGGLRIDTSLDLSTQEIVQEMVSQEIDKLQDLKVGNGAVLVTNPKTGEILAMVGSHDYFDKNYDGNVNVTLSLRQPGSSIKVVNYAAALEKGFTAATILDDTPITYKSAFETYTPVNYDGKFHGRVPLRYALGNSYNIPAVKTLNTIGVQTMIDMGKKMGITTWNDPNRYGLSLTLGGGEVTMLDMAKVYGTLANTGKKVELNPIIKVTDYKGNVIQDFRIQNGIQNIAPETAFILSDILADNNARINAFGPNSQLVIKDHTVSVKTGTTNDKRDNWTIGYTPSIVITVWVGNNDNSPMDPQLTSGVTGAAPIWNRIMTEILKNKPDEKMQKPEGIIEVQICSINGLLPCEGCPTRKEYFINGTEPKSACTKIEPTSTPTP